MNLLIWLIMIGYIIGFFIGIFYWKMDRKQNGDWADNGLDFIYTVIHFPFTSISIFFILWILIITKTILYAIFLGLLILIGIIIVYWSEIKEFLNKGEDE